MGKTKINAMLHSELPPLEGEEKIKYRESIIRASESADGIVRPKTEDSITKTYPLRITPSFNNRIDTVVGYQAMKQKRKIPKH